ncbi:hypothetical protein T492DRAFT_1010340, partial [Pavlovales sp. CCMP2436]
FAMDIGELWTLDGSSAKSMKMTKLYISPDVYERHSSRILYPDEDPRSNPSAAHRYSRELCVRAVVRGEPMWCDLSSPPATPASDESAGSEMKLRTAVLIPFTIGSDGCAAVIVLYSQSWRPLPPKQVMSTLTEFTRSVASVSSMARFLSTLSKLSLTSASKGESRSVTDRLGLESSASVPACLHALDAAQIRSSRSSIERAIANGESAPTPTITPDAPLMRQSSGSTFAQRRLQQLLLEPQAEETA